MEPQTEPTVKPLTLPERVLAFITRNRAHVALLALLLAGLIILAVSLRGCQPGFSVSVPEDWLTDYHQHYDTSQGSASYSFFANLVRSLTQKPFITYDLDELGNSDYAKAREEYLWNDTNVSRLSFLRNFPMPENEVWHDLAIFDLPNPPGLQDYRDVFLANMARMKNYGVYSYTGLDRYQDYGPDSTGFSLFFANAPAFNQDSELLLNLFLPLDKGSPEIPYRIDSAATTAAARRLRLALNNREMGFNSDLLFRGSATPRNDVLNRRSALGFYLKYREEKGNKGRDWLREEALDVGKVYLVWSPDIPRRELLWLYNEYLGPAAQKFGTQNSSISLNHHWLPDKYPFQAEEVKAALAAVDQEKKNLQISARGKQSYQIYYDHSSIRDYASLVAHRSDGQATLIAKKAMPAAMILRDMKANKDIRNVIYIYGVSLHSIYNLPTEVISRSFWYNAEDGKELYQDVQQYISTFGLKINTSGEIDPREFSQYADLERELTIGSRENRTGGLFPLFTVPYVMVYNAKEVKDIRFNSTRGFLQLQAAKPVVARKPRL